jgi:hypothetical protein
MVWIVLLIVVALIFPEMLVLAFSFLCIAGYGILEFILRLFGKSFEDKNKNK